MSNTSQHRASKARVSLVGVTAIVLVGALASCASGPAPSDGEITELNIVLHDNPQTTIALTDLTEKFEEANPSIKVNLSFIPTNDYGAARTARLAAGEADIVEGPGGTANATPAPDYTTGLPDSDWVKGVEAGQWVDMSGEDFISNFNESVIESLAIDGKTYQIPTALSLYGVFYNKDIFEENDVDVPTTWSEFESVLEDLQSAGVTPISTGGKDRWPLGLTLQALVPGTFPTTDDLHALDEGIWDGSVSLDDPEFIEVMSKLATVNSYTDPNFAGIDYATAEGQFVGGQVAMTIDGTWAIQQFADQNPALNMGYFPLPASEDAENNTALHGKIDALGFAIPTSSKAKDAALEWIGFVSEPENYQEFVVTGGIIPVQDGAEASDLLEEVLGDALDAPFSPAWGTVFHTNPDAGVNVSGMGFNYLGLSPLGTFATPEEAQQAAQADWQAGLK